MYKKPLYQVLARKLSWNPVIPEFVAQQEAELKRLTDKLPSGAGWDSGTKIDRIASRENRIVLWGSYHHMNEQGSYDGWTEHAIIVTPSLTDDFNLDITGPNRNDIKDYLTDLFDGCLREEVHVYAKDEDADKAKP